MYKIPLVSLMVVALASCTPMVKPSEITSTFTNTPRPAETDTPILARTPTSTSELAQTSSSKDEIVNFMVDYIVKNEIEATIDIITKEKPPMIEKPPAQFIIVYSPISGTIGNDYSKLMNALDTNNAEKAWIYENGKLTAQAEPLTAIKNYHQKFIQNAPVNPGIFTWGYDEFGIVSISNDGQSADVYLADSCGSVCGSGILLTIEKNSDGKWIQKNIKTIWGS